MQTVAQRLIEEPRSDRESPFRARRPIPIVDEAARGTHRGVGDSLPAAVSGGRERPQLLGVLTKEITPKGYRTNVKSLARCGEIRRHRAIERVAALAAVDLGILAEFLPGRFLFLAESEAQRVVVVPALQMPDAQFALGVLLITGALPGFLVFDL